MSAGAKNKPHSPQITANTVGALPGRGEKIPGQETLEHHRAYILGKHQENAKPYFEAAYGLQRAQSSIPTPEAKMVEFEQIDGVKGLLEAMNHTTGEFDANDNLFLGYMNIMGMQKQAEARVNTDVLDASPDGDIPVTQEERLANRHSFLGEKVRQITDKQNAQQTKIDALKAVNSLETTAEKAHRLAEIETLEREVALYKDQVDVVDTYRGKIWDATQPLPTGNEADNFFEVTEDAKILRANGEEPSAALLEEIRVAKAKLEAVMEFRVAELNMYQVMAVYEGRIPNDVEQLEPDSAIAETWQKQPGWPASEKLEAQLREHNDRQDYLYALEMDLTHASDKHAFWNATIPRKLANVALSGLKGASYGTYSAFDKFQQKRYKPRNVTRKPGETDAELAARRQPHSAKAMDRERARRPRRHRRLEKMKPTSHSEKYEAARDAYLDEKLKGIFEDVTLSDSEKFGIQSYAAVEESDRMMKLTNEHTRKSAMGQFNWLLHERMSTPQRLLAGAALTIIGGPGMLAFGLATYAGSRADHKMRGKMGKGGNSDAWVKKMTAGLAKESHARLKQNVGNNMSLERMRGLEYDQKFLTMKEINAYLSGHYNKAVAGEMARHLVGPAVGTAALTGMYNLDKLAVANWLPDPSGLLDILDEATTATEPGSDYGARAMSNRIGMN